MQDGLSGRQIAWGVLAQVWVDTSYDDAQLAAFRAQLAATGLSSQQLQHLAYREVCGAFALFTLAVYASAGMALPDWFYPEEDARQQVSAWLARPRLLSLLNPFWLLGYLLAVGLMRSTMQPVLSPDAQPS